MKWISLKDKQPDMVTTEEGITLTPKDILLYYHKRGIIHFGRLWKIDGKLTDGGRKDALEQISHWAAVEPPVETKKKK